MSRSFLGKGYLPVFPTRVPGFTYKTSTRLSEVVHPGDQSFDLPTSSVASQLPSILGLLFSIAAVGRDHRDAVLLGQDLVERIRVVGHIADLPLGQLFEEASGQNSFHKLALGMRSAFDRYGERKTVASIPATSA